MGNTEAPKRICLHCQVELVNERPWPGLGFLADCPVCTSSFLRRYQPARDRENRLIDSQERAFLEGRTGATDRWVRAWKVVAQAYRLEENKDAAARCLGNALVLLGWQEGGLRGAEEVRA